jgi:hypothetical protein
MAKIITTVGHAQVDTAIKKIGTGSLLLDAGGDDRLTTPNNADFAFGAGDYTIEFWVYRLYV